MYKATLNFFGCTKDDASEDSEKENHYNGNLNNLAESPISTSYTNTNQVSTVSPDHNSLNEYVIHSNPISNEKNKLPLKFLELLAGQTEEPLNKNLATQFAADSPNEGKSRSLVDEIKKRKILLDEAYFAVDTFEQAGVNSADEFDRTRYDNHLHTKHNFRIVVSKETGTSSAPVSAVTIFQQINSPPEPTQPINIPIKTLPTKLRMRRSRSQE
jgi:hypothetical protein